MTRYATQMVDLTHPIALLGHAGPRGPRRKRGRVYAHKVALFDKIGYGPHLCHWCGEHIAWMRGARQGVVIADHLDDNPLNNSPDNLVQSCNRCNTMRARTEYRPTITEEEFYVQQNSNSPYRTRAEWVTCEECGIGFLASVARIKRGTVSLCSRSCAGKRGSRSRWGSRAS